VYPIFIIINLCTILHHHTGSTCYQTLLPLNYLASKSFDFGSTWWMLFQKRIVYTKLYIYVFMTTI